MTTAPEQPYDPDAEGTELPAPDPGDDTEGDDGTNRDGSNE